MHTSNTNNGMVWYGMEFQYEKLSQHDLLSDLE